MDIDQEQFIEDTLDLLNELDEGLMQLEVNPFASAPLEQVFRVMHTIKGAAYMFGFDNIGELAHHLETLYDMVRQGKVQTSDRLISITLHAFDKVRDLLRKKNIRKIKQADALKGHLVAITHFLKDVEMASVDWAATEKDDKGQLATYLVRIIPKIEITVNGNHPLPFVVKDLETLGTTKTFLYQGTDTAISGWDLIIATAATQAEIESYFIFVEKDCAFELLLLGQGNLWDVAMFLKTVDSFQKNKISKERLREISENLSKEYRSTGKAFDSENQEKGKPTGKDTDLYDGPVIKVSKQKVDNLLNKISELVILKSRLLNLAEQNQGPLLAEIAERLEGVSNQLLQISLDISMVRIETLVTQFRRLVRDLSKSLGKKVNFISKGGSTEMDKDIIEMMASPLLHLVRNAIDHGIEPPEIRKAQGKPEHGAIKLETYRSNAFINLVIHDDGKGIDKEKVLRKAIEKGIVGPNTPLTEEEVFNYIFHPGLSTAETVSDLSGRGVGMDAVKQKVTELRGAITVASTPGLGTSFHIKLPLSRSIINGLLVTVGGTPYIVPLNEIKHIDRIPSTLLDRGHKVHLEVMVNGKPLLVFSLREQFYPGNEPPKTSDIISVSINGSYKGIAVDSIEGLMQVVLKPMGAILPHQDFISGSAILGDGKVALVLDPQKLFHKYA